MEKNEIMELDIINWISNQGFAIIVIIYLLYERSKINIRIILSLEKITTILDSIERQK